MILHRALPAAAAALIAIPLSFGSVSAAEESRDGYGELLDGKIRETPVERALTNLISNPVVMSAAEHARAQGRMHLLAYIRKPGPLSVSDRDALYRGSANRSAPRAPDDADLKASVAAYIAARDLEPSNLRTRSALAFALDRSGRLPEARAELRFAAQSGLQRARKAKASGKPLDAETAIVLTEVTEHLEEIQQTREDRRVLEEVDQVPVTVGTIIVSRVTPIMVPLVDGLEASDHIDLGSNVKFDFTGQGLAMKAGWLKPTAAWLVWDPAEREKITSGFQLFGSVTWVAHWDNGYRPLSVLDNNADGKVEGTELAGLSVWTDLNQNGRSDRGEVKTLAEAGIVALGYDYFEKAPGLWESRSGVTFADGTVRSTYDWTFEAPSVALRTARR